MVSSGLKLDGRAFELELVWGPGGDGGTSIIYMSNYEDAPLHWLYMGLV